MEELLKLFRYAFAPESDWGKFSRKLIGIIVSASLGAFVFGIYYNRYQIPRLGERPVNVVIQSDTAKEARVRRIINALLSSDRHIESVRIYSWPDARQLVSVMNVGNPENPLPGGSFVIDDAHLLGLFLFGECGELERGFDNYTCPINGLEDSWGILVVDYGDGSNAEDHRLTNSRAAAAAHRIGLILYSNSNHLGELGS